MKHIIKKTSVTLALAVCFSACSSGSLGTATPSTAEDSHITAENIQTDTADSVGSAVLRNVVPETNVNPAALTGFTFEYSSLGDNYILTVNSGNNGAYAHFTVENKDFNEVSVSFKSPDGFSFIEVNKNTVKVLESPSDDGNAPDIIELIFSDDSGNKAALFYAVTDGRLSELAIYKNSGLGIEPVGFSTDFTLIPTENFKFLVPPKIDFYANGQVIAALDTYTFDPNTLTMTLSPEKTTYDNPLYFGWAAFETANEIYSYFADKTLPIDETAAVVAVTSIVDNETYRYYKVSDERFSDLSQFKAFVGKYFSAELTENMFAASPQKYRDINGELYTLQSTLQKDPTIGATYIVDYLIEDGNIAYRTLRYYVDSEGNVTQTADGGDFIIIPNANSFIVEQYKYPFK